MRWILLLIPVLFSILFWIKAFLVFFHNSNQVIDSNSKFIHYGLDFLYEWSMNFFLLSITLLLLAIFFSLEKNISLLTEFKVFKIKEMEKEFKEKEKKIKEQIKKEKELSEKKKFL